MKNGVLNYVLEVDVLQDAGTFYYMGYFHLAVPMNTTDYQQAAKFVFRDEAETLCEIINSLELNPVKYRVCEHVYEDLSL